MAIDPRTLSRFRRVAAAAIVVVAFAGSVWATWERWGDVIIDCGRELDTPKQLLAGKQLYGEVRYWYGPLAPYANAVLYRIFGVKVSTLTWAGIAAAALMAGLTYRTVRLFTGRLAAAATASALCYTSLFYQCCRNNIFTFALPYAYPATYGLVAAAGSVYFLLRHVWRGRERDFLLSAVLLGVASLSKVEVLFAAWVAHGVFLLTRALAAPPNSARYAYGYGVALGIPVLVFGYFGARVGPGLVTDNLVGPVVGDAGGFWVLHGGFDDLAGSLADLAWSVVGLGACIVLALLAGWAEARLEGSAGGAGRWAALGPIVLVSATCAEIVRRLGPGRLFRALPLLLAVAMGVWAVRWSTAPARRPERAAPLILGAFALALMLRMGLRAGTEHYGFYLLVPGLMALAVVYCRDVPAMVRRWWGGAALAPYAAGVALLATAGIVHGVHTQEVAAATYGPGETPRVVTAQGAMPCPQKYRGTVDEAIRRLATQPPATTVVVIPEGAGITFLAGCTNPLGVHTFLPIDFSGAYDDTAMVARLDRAKPDVIVVTARDTSEYGPRRFAVDYGVAVMHWIEANYVIGERLDSHDYRLLMLRRAGS